MTSMELHYPVIQFLIKNALFFKCPPTASTWGQNDAYEPNWDSFPSGSLSAPGARLQLF